MAHPLHQRPGLSRSEFNAAVFARDHHRCVKCGRNDAIEAHHIVDRKLFDDGSDGYFLDNGVTVCPDCHVLAEKTLLSCEELRTLAGIKHVVLPDHFTADEGERYDKWGNQVLPNGTRMKGDLFFDDGCQRMLAAAGLLGSFRPYVKYPKTMHLPFSPNLQNGDRVIRSLDGFDGEEVVATIKMDGESASLYPDYYHARSIDSKHHDSRNMAKALHAQIRHEIPDGWRICCENMQAQHSIRYEDLTSPLYVLNIWNERNICLSWDDTLGYAGILGLPTVKEIYRGPWDLKRMQELGEMAERDGHEGFVVRVTGTIRYSEWRRLVAKYVRRNHVQTTNHWMTSWRNNGFVNPEGGQ